MFVSKCLRHLPKSSHALYPNWIFCAQMYLQALTILREFVAWERDPKIMARNTASRSTKAEPKNAAVAIDCNLLYPKVCSTSGTNLRCCVSTQNNNFCQPSIYQWKIVCYLCWLRYVRARITTCDFIEFHFISILSRTGAYFRLQRDLKRIFFVCKRGYRTHILHHKHQSSYYFEFSGISLKRKIEWKHTRTAKDVKWRRIVL